MSTNEISASDISKRIVTIRGYQVLLDMHIAETYEVETRMVKRAVRRNPERFPQDFGFELTKEESEFLISQFEISNVKFGEKNSDEDHLRPQNLISQIGISSLGQESRAHGGNRHAPFAFTEQGVAMLSSVLNSKRAIQVNIEIMRAFVQLRKERESPQTDLNPRLDSLEHMLKTGFQRLEERLKLSAPKALAQTNSQPVDTIQNIVALHFGVSIDDLKSSLRTQAISLPRHIAIYLVRNYLRLSFTQIGRHFGARDHTSILHAFQKIHALSQDNKMIQAALHTLQNEVSAAAT